MRIGIVGTGHIGGTLARLLAQSRRGYELAISNSRGPETLQQLAKELGPAVRATTVEEAARYGEVVIVSIPFGRIHELPAAAFAGKIVVDTGNYYPGRDGHFRLLDEDQTTSSELLQDHLKGARVVKGFNSILWSELGAGGRPRGQPGRIGVPISGDDPMAKRIVAGIIDNIGYDAVDAGRLSEGGRRHQVGTPVYGKALPSAELARRLQMERAPAEVSPQP